MDVQGESRLEMKSIGKVNKRITRSTKALATRTNKDLRRALRQTLALKRRFLRSFLLLFSLVGQICEET